MKTEDLKTILLFLFILTLAAGSGSLLFKINDFTVFAFRITVIIIPVILIFKNHIYKFDNRNYNFLFAFFSFFLLYGLVSISWSENFYYSIKAIIHIITALLMFFILASLAQSVNNFFKKFVNFWIIGFIFNIIVALIEILTGHHFISEYSVNLHKLSATHYAVYSPATVFGNPNHFAIYIVSSLMLFVIFRRTIPTALNTFLITTGLIICYFTYSRLALISLMFPMGLIIYLEWNKIIPYFRDRNYRMIFISIIMMLVSVFAFSDFINPMKIPGSKTTVVIKKDNVKSSESIRKNLFMEGMYYLKESNGIGIGAGQFQHYKETRENKYESFGTTSPHSGVIEIVSEFGIPVFFTFIIFWIWFGISVFKKKKTEGILIYAVYSVALVLLSNANSGFVSSPVCWMLIIIPVIILTRKQKNIAEFN